jgi:hypothetical protein
MCNSAFHLKKDLERHKRTVHREAASPESGYTVYTCQNPQCSSPNTVFSRKDNFERHVKRCVIRQERGRARSGGVGRVEMAERKIVAGALSK